MNIHPTAIVSPEANLGANVRVDPYAIIESGVVVGDGSVIRAHAHLCRGTTLGSECDIHMNAVIGNTPQDFSYKGEPVHTILGNRVTVREYVTVHGTVGGNATLIGDGSYLMVSCHVAHDCKLGKNVMLVNSALLAGHVEVGDGAIISGNAVLHQYTRIGTLAIVAGGALLGMDLPPYMIGVGINSMTGINRVGLRRAAHISENDRNEIRSAHKILYRSGLELPDALKRIEAELKGPAVAELVKFITFPSKRGFLRHRVGVRRGTNETTD